MSTLNSLPSQSAQIIPFPVSDDDFNNAIDTVEHVTGWSHEEAIFFTVNLRERNLSKQGGGKQNVRDLCIDLGYAPNYFHDAMRIAVGLKPLSH